jgi:hypothetical protein
MKMEIITNLLAISAQSREMVDFRKRQGKENEFGTLIMSESKTAVKHCFG